MAAAGSSDSAPEPRRISLEERRVQLMDLARAKISEIEPEKLRRRKFMFVAPRGLAEREDSDAIRRNCGAVFIAHTRAGAILAFEDWRHKIQPELSERIHEKCGHHHPTAQHYVDSFFAPNHLGYYFVELPTNAEEMRSPDCEFEPSAANSAADSAVRSAAGSDVGSDATVVPTHREQLIELARSKLSEIDPEKLRLRRFIHAAPRAALKSPFTSVEMRRMLNTMYIAHTRAGAILAYLECFESNFPGGTETFRSLMNPKHARVLNQEVVDRYFDAKYSPCYIAEIPLEPEEVYSPDCTVGPNRATDEPDVDDE